MPDSDDTADTPSRPGLSKVAQAVMDVLVRCHSDLSAARRRLQKNDTSDPDLEPRRTDVDAEQRSPPREQALNVAAQLEACASALRKNASGQDRPPS